MGIIEKLKTADKKASKYFPIFGILIYGFLCGFKWSGNEFIWNSMAQDIIIGLILLNQGVIVSYITFYRD